MKIYILVLVLFVAPVWAVEKVPAHCEYPEIMDIREVQGQVWYKIRMLCYVFGRDSIGWYSSPWWVLKSEMPEKMEL